MCIRDSAWAVPYILNCKDALNKGKNTLRIKVTSSKKRMTVKKGSKNLTKPLILSLIHIFIMLFYFF